MDEKIKKLDELANVEKKSLLEYLKKSKETERNSGIFAPIPAEQDSEWIKQTYTVIAELDKKCRL